MPEDVMAAEDDHGDVIARSEISSDRRNQFPAGLPI